MHKNYRQILQVVAGVTLLAGAQLVSAATTFNITGANADHSLSLLEDGITASISAWAINKGDGTIETSYMTSYGAGTGICGPGDSDCGNPNHAADNDGSHQDLFLIEFSQAVFLDRAGITEWGGANSDSDATFWAGTGSAGLVAGGTFAPAADRHDDEILSSVLSDGDWRAVDLTPAAGAVDWLMIGAVFDEADTYRDYLKLQTLDVSAIPVPAAVWLFGSGLAGLFGFVRRRRASAA